jgi:uncharacterized membrane protein YgdD (TMEM256/DUF423 family)
MTRLWICAAAVNGFLAVAMGALAAHGLQGRVPPQALDWIEIGARYGALHALALLGVAALSARRGSGARWLTAAGWAFVAGSILFSATLYAMGLTGAGALAKLVPAGGISFMAGWLALLVYGLTARSGASEGPSA